MPLHFSGMLFHTMISCYCTVRHTPVPSHNKTDVACQETLSCIRSINPNFNHFASQSHLCFLVIFIISFFVSIYFPYMHSLSVHEAIKFLYSYPVWCQLSESSQTAARCHWLAVSLCSVAFPEMMSVGIKKSISTIQMYCINFLVSWIHKHGFSAVSEWLLQ